MRKDYKTFHQEVSRACNVVEKRRHIMSPVRWADKFYVMIARMLKRKNIKFTAEELYDEVEFVKLHKKKPYIYREDYEKHKFGDRLVDKILNIKKRKDNILKIEKEVFGLHNVR